MIDFDKFKFSVEGTDLLLQIEDECVLYSDLIGAIHQFLTNDMCSFELHKNIREDGDCTHIGIFNGNNEHDGTFLIESVTGGLSLEFISVDAPISHDITFSGVMNYRVYPIKVKK